MWPVLRLSALLALGGVLLAGHAAQAGCREAWDAIEAAVARQDADAVVAAWDATHPEDVCNDAEVLRALRRDAGQVYVTVGLRLLQRNDVVAAQSLADRATGLDDNDWRMQMLKADLAHNRKDYTTAADAYQLAYNSANDAAQGPDAPSAGELEHIYRRMIEARQLAAQFSPAPKTRAGRFGGPYEPRITVEGVASGPGISIVGIPAPIQFDFDSDRIETEKDRAAAAELCAYLRDRKARGETTVGLLIGHTDQVGSNAYNDDLSRRRASAAARYLSDRDCGAAVLRTEGRGKREPLQLSDPTLYGPDELSRLNRRVELVLK